MFFIVAIASAFVVGMDIYIMTISPRVGFGLLFKSLVFFLLAALNTLFMYVMCTRSLLK